MTYKVLNLTRLKNADLLSRFPKPDKFSIYEPDDAQKQVIYKAMTVNPEVTRSQAAEEFTRLFLDNSLDIIVTDLSLPYPHEVLFESNTWSEQNLETKCPPFMVLDITSEGEGCGEDALLFPIYEQVKAIAVDPYEKLREMLRAYSQK